MKNRYPDGLCDCSCGHPCPFGKRGMELRCNIPRLLEHFECTLEELPKKLDLFREEEIVRIKELHSHGTLEVGILPLFVWQLKASLDNPFTDGILERESTTVFATKELAESRFEVFRNLIRTSLKLEDDYEVRVEAVPMEVIQN